MEETPPGSWPTAEKSRDGYIKDRDSQSLSTAESEEPPEELSKVVEKEDLVIEDRGKATDHTGRLGIFRMPELPPEIRET